MDLLQIASDLDDYTLADRYLRTEGRVFLTGTQALLRVMLDQRRRDIAAGLKTAGCVSGYRGSPLGGVDQTFMANRELIADHDITFIPAINEDLAATALLGSQQVETDPTRTVDGVFGIWYGKGPGVDRSGDALKHGNAYGSSPHGGVLVVAGDDHGCVSSSMGAPVGRRIRHLLHADPQSGGAFAEISAAGRRIRLCAVALYRHVGRLQSDLRDRSSLRA